MVLYGEEGEGKFFSLSRAVSDYTTYVVLIGHEAGSKNRGS